MADDDAQIRKELKRLGKRYADAQEKVTEAEAELGRWFSKAQASEVITMSDAAQLANIKRGLAYKILRRG